PFLDIHEERHLSLTEEAVSVDRDERPSRSRRGQTSGRRRDAMKITRLRIEIPHIPFTPPIGSSLHQLNSADCVLVFLETDAGLVGEGLAFALNNSRLKVIHEMVLSFEPLVVGLDPELGGSIAAGAFWDLNFLGHKGVSIVGLAGIETALWDLRGKA